MAAGKWGEKINREIFLNSIKFGKGQRFDVMAVCNNEYLEKKKKIVGCRIFFSTVTAACIEIDFILKLDSITS